MPCMGGLRVRPDRLWRDHTDFRPGTWWGTDDRQHVTRAARPPIRGGSLLPGPVGPGPAGVPAVQVVLVLDVLALGRGQDLVVQRRLGAGDGVPRRGERLVGLLLRLPGLLLSGDLTVLRALPGFLLLR